MYIFMILLNLLLILYVCLCPVVVFRHIVIVVNTLLENRKYAATCKLATSYGRKVKWSAVIATIYLAGQ